MASRQGQFGSAIHIYTFDKHENGKLPASVPLDYPAEQAFCVEDQTSRPMVERTTNCGAVENNKLVTGLTYSYHPEIEIKR